MAVAGAAVVGEGVVDGYCRNVPDVVVYHEHCENVESSW
jgi:hypothetical protein